jgi:hypothetical protein
VICIVTKPYLPLPEATVLELDLVGLVD